jgi:hypothetical protein
MLSPDHNPESFSHITTPEKHGSSCTAPTVANNRYHQVLGRKNPHMALLRANTGTGVGGCTGCDGVARIFGKLESRGCQNGAAGEDKLGACDT